VITSFAFVTPIGTAGASAGTSRAPSLQGAAAPRETGAMRAAAGVMAAVGGVVMLL